MTLLKQLLPLAALLLLSIVPTETEVVTSVEQCNEFFLEQNPPNITTILEGGKILNQSRYKLICQTLNNTRTFVTLYDTQNKIPVFSAAKFNGSTSGRPQIPWMIEPQLEKPSDNPNMRPSNNSTNYKHQAGDQDYKYNIDFDRGHLFPSSYGSTVLKRNSTFTLTNIVPQNKDFNSGSWNKMENCIKCVLNEYCKNNSNIEGFVVIGAQPSNENLLNQRINIPSVLWSAFCCYRQSQNSWLASAHWGENKDDGPKYLQTKTLGELHKEWRIEFKTTTTLKLFCYTCIQKKYFIVQQY
uniref:Endonuclease domain-containing 1 protein-like n=1 Tax=Astatotilapia calliptera TaxID=8154 RepID=A0AAX7TM48_ASTCA